jgi:hypothetical protein
MSLISQENVGMTNRIEKLAMLLLAAMLCIPSLIAKDQTWTGEISDSMCGTEHMMQGSKADCTKKCVAQGSTYALVVGGKVYTLQSSDKATLDALGSLAGQNAAVVGKADGETITVSSVRASK